MIRALTFLTFFTLFLFAFSGSPTAAEPPKTLKVAAAQMRSSKSLKENMQKIAALIRDCASNGVQVVAFPECALTGYFEDVIRSTTAQDLADAEAQIAKTCNETKVWAIVGTPRLEGDKIFNSASVFSPSGEIIERYDKIQLAESWPVPGEHLSLFKVAGVPCSIIICHDERYPELVRLPVLAGAQLVFYISHESGLNEEKKIAPYRAQIQARAVEDTIYIVHANAPANADNSGSHGQSRIIAPDGNILREASIHGEEVVTSEININKASRDNAKKSLIRGPLQDWWKDGIRRVLIIPDNSSQ